MKDPVEIRTYPCLETKLLATVPFPAPGGPNRTIFPLYIVSIDGEKSPEGVMKQIEDVLNLWK